MEFRSEAARRSKENGELLVEMLRVVFQAEPKDRQAFAAYHSSLNQGASLEGVLNGLTHSAAYRRLEQGSPVATGEARAFFVDELVRLQAGMEEPLPLDAKSGSPLRKFDFPTGLEKIETGAGKKRVKKAFDAEKAKKEYAVLFSGSSLPTLKRVLIDATVLRVGTAGTGLGEWYSEQAARLGGMGVDFGLTLRNRTDSEFHHAWYVGLLDRMSIEAAKDRVLWESLNRTLRVLNALNTKPSNPSESKANIERSRPNGA